MTEYRIPQYCILVRHGRYHTYAVTDETRELTETGREEIRRMADHLAGREIGVRRILHSGKMRARQTAEIFAACFGVACITESRGLRPEDDPEALIRSIQAQSESTLMVGHLPLLDRVAERMSALAAYPGPLSFPQGGALCLIRNENGLQVDRMITPDMLRA